MDEATPEAMGENFRAQINDAAKPSKRKKYDYHRKDALLSVPPSDMTPAQQAKALTTASRLKQSKLRHAILAEMEEEDMQDVARALLKRAKNGHVASAREIRAIIGNVPDETETKGTAAPGGVVVILKPYEQLPSPVIEVLDVKPDEAK